MLNNIYLHQKFKITEYAFALFVKIGYIGFSNFTYMVDLEVNIKQEK